jgi:1-acyl-sn-glycerol-3-phosphate acyltransferase
MIPKKPVPHLMRDGHRFSEKIMRHQEGEAGLLIVRSVAFNILFYLNLVLHVVAAIPTYALPRRAFMAMARSWGDTSNWLLRVVAGTRTELRGLDKIPPGALPAYKSGVAQLYAACGVPCLPVALNSGLYWPRRKFLRYPGTIVLEVLDPIPPGLSRDEFMERLEREIEQATDRLTSEGEREPAYSRASAGRHYGAGTRPL